MKIEEPRKKLIRDLFSLETANERYEVPAYQRRYDWGKKECKELLEDIQRIEEGGKHFLGSIIVLSGTHKTGGEINTLKIIDGQQRITTISILLCTIRNIMMEKNKEGNGGNQEADNIVAEIEKRLNIVNLRGEKIATRLTLNNIDKRSYSNLIKKKFNDIDNRNILAVYINYKKWIQDLGTNEIIKLYKKIINALLYIQIQVQSPEDQYFLFEAMNNRGLPLSPVDLMKNYAFLKAFEKGDIIESEVEEIWTDIIRNLDEIDISKPAITFFRHYFMSSKKYGVNEKVTESKSVLYDKLFKKRIDNCDDIKEFLLDIKKDSELFSKLLTQNIDKFNRSINYEINGLLKDTKTVSITCFTLLLRAFKELKDDYKSIKKIIEIMNTVFVRRHITGERTAEHDQFSNFLAQNAFSEDRNSIEFIKGYFRKKNRYPDDNKFKEHLQKGDFKNNDFTCYILSRIEQDYFGHGGTEVSQSRYKVHIEHILPEGTGKTIKENWLIPLNISEEEHKNHRKKIGNLTLLEQKPNQRMGAAPYKEKKEFYEKESDFKMTKEVTKNLDSWGIKEIEKRGKRLAEYAVKVWKL